MAQKVVAAMVVAVAAASIAAAAQPVREGWTDIGSIRTVVPSSNPLWMAPTVLADFNIERRDGAEGTVEVLGTGTGAVLRVSKTNAKG